MTTDALDPAALLSAIPGLLPVDKPTLSSPQDGITALIHSVMTAVSFRLTAVQDESTHTLPDNRLPAEWNAGGPGNYTLKYRHEQSSLEFLLKITKLGPRTLLNAIAVESDRAASLDIGTVDFVSPSFFPHDLARPDGQPLVHGFISSSRVSDFVSQFKLKILQKLIPGLNKEGYVEEREQQSTSTTTAPTPSTAPPARSQPRFPIHNPDDDSFLRQPPRFPPQNPLSIGRRDLDPFPGLSFNPPPLFPGSSGDGMFVGPDHPIFAGHRNRDPTSGPWGGDGFLPAVPPGARFDPIVPGPGPFPGPGRRIGPNSGEPDNDEFMPPGVRDMFG